MRRREAQGGGAHFRQFAGISERLTDRCGKPGFTLDTARRPGGDRIFGGLQEIEGMRADECRAAAGAASIRFCPPSGSRLPPMKATSASV